jgi:hypothetical protein
MKTLRSLGIFRAAVALSLLILVDWSYANSLGSALVGSVPQNKTRDSVNLVVTVRDSDGKPVANARVNVWQNRVGPLSGSPDYQGDTTPNGVAVVPVNITRNFFTSKPQVDLVIRVVKTDFDVKEERVSVTGNIPDQITRTVTIRRFAIEAGETTMKVRVETFDGLPVAAAQVVIWANRWPTRLNYPGQTDADGNAEIRIKPFADLEIKASKPGIGEASISVLVTSQSPSSFTVKLPKPNGAVVTITVKDAKNQQGVRDALVTVSGSGFYSDVTDAAGKALLVIPETGSLSVGISQNTYETLGNGEIKLEGEKEKSFEFELTPKPSKEGPNSIEVTVLAADKTDRSAIERSNMPLPFAAVTVGGTTAPTDSRGVVKILGDFTGRVEVAVEAQGYKRQVKTVFVADTVRFSGSHASVTFMMQAEDSQDYIEVIVVADEKDCFRHCPPVEGATVTAGATTATTDANGRAVLQGRFDDEPIRVQKSGFKTQFQQASSSRSSRFSAGVSRGSVTFKLEPASTESSIDVVVLGESPNGSESAPINGAKITIGTVTVTTDANGRAKLRGEFGEAADIAAEAKGYFRHSAKVSIDKQSRTASAALYLKPDLPVRLIVEVLDAAKPNTPLEGASVYVFRLGTRTQPLAVQETNKQGEAGIELKGSADQLSQIRRSGLTLNIFGSGDYEQKKLSDVTPDLLQPSTEARRVTVFLNRDWAELRRAVDGLEPRVLAWNNEITAAGQAAATAEKLAEQARQAKQKVAALVSEIEYAGQAANGANGISAISLKCREATRLKSNIQGHRAEAAAKEQALKTVLNNASALAANCSSARDGEAVKRMYREAIQLVGAIGAIEKKAVEDGNNLKLLLNQLETLQKIIDGVEKNVAEIAREAAKAEQAVAAVGPALVRAQNLYASLTSRRNALTGELQTLRTKYNLDNSVDGLPADLVKRVDVMTQLVGKQNNNVFGGPGVDPAKTVQEVASQLQQDKARAEKYLTNYKSGAAGKCDVEAMDNVVQEIGTMVTNSSFELGLHAELSGKAQDCINKGNCQPIINEARTLFERYAIEEATAKINEARIKGCDVSGLDEELDYWKTLRDAIVYLKVRQQRCEFREAYEWSLNLPVSIRNRPLMKETMIGVYNGLKAQERIGQLRRTAKSEVARTNQVSSAQPFIRQAEEVAAPYPCLVEEVSSFRNEFPATATTDQKPTDEVPGVLGENKPRNQNPTDEIPTALGGLTGTLGSSRPPFRPPGEKKPGGQQMPTDEVPGALGSGTSRPPVKDGSGSSTGTGTTGRSGSTTSGAGSTAGQRPCNASEASAFSLMTGNWKTGGPKISIGGSCEKASGTFEWAEYCESPDRTDNKTLARYKGTFTGRMEGGSLQFSFELPGGALHKDQKGTSSCSVGQDGSLSCSLGCAIIGAKKQ